MGDIEDVWYVYEELVRDRDEFVLVDCRDESERALAVIGGAVHHPTATIEADPNILDRSKEIVLFCHRGDVSAKVVTFLKQHGFRNVKSLAGGVHAYAELVDPGIPSY
jgi:rhodanese-related sulfurtransferase